MTENGPDGRTGVLPPPPRPTGGDSDVQRVTEYLLAYRDISDMSRLNAELRRSGWSLEEIDAAWARVWVEDPRPDESPGRDWPRDAVWFAVGIALLIGFGVLVWWLFPDWIGNSRGWPVSRQ